MSKPKQSNVEELNCVINNDLSKKKYNRKDLDSNISPMTERQREFFRAFDRDVPIVTQMGSAGTGKTMIAIYKALCEVFDQGQYQNLTIIRPPVESRSIGFLKGDMADKLAVYERPYRDIIEQVITCDDKKGHYDNLKALGYVEFMPTSFLRGTTFDNTIMVIDEAQNADFKELITCITRIGKNSKLIICGDTLQDDLQRKKEKSGISDIIEILKIMGDDYHQQIVYTPEDIVRSELVKRFLIAHDKFCSRSI